MPKCAATLPAARNERLPATNRDRPPGRRNSIDAGASRFFDARVPGHHGEPCRPKWRRQDHADALDHGPSEADAGHNPFRRRGYVSAAASWSRGARDRLYAGRSRAGASADRRRKYFVTVMGDKPSRPQGAARFRLRGDRRTRRDAPSQGAIVERRSAETCRARTRARHWDKVPAVGRTVRRNCAGARRAAFGSPCFAEAQGPHFSDVAIGHESFPRADRRGVYDRARRQPRSPSGVIRLSVGFNGANCLGRLRQLRRSGLRGDMSARELRLGRFGYQLREVGLGYGESYDGCKDYGQQENSEAVAMVTTIDDFARSIEWAKHGCLHFVHVPAWFSP